MLNLIFAFAIDSLNPGVEFQSLSVSCRPLQGGLNVRQTYLRTTNLLNLFCCEPLGTNRDRLDVRRYC